MTPSSKVPRSLPLPPHFQRRDAKNLLRARGFTLIETALAIGIVAFALIPVVGLMPVGLTTFRKAIDSSVCCYIAQQVITDIEQGSSVVSDQTGDGSSQGPKWRYFDFEGTQLTATNSAVPPPNALYWVNTPVKSTSALPGGQSSNLATVAIEIVKNPQNTQPTVADDGHVQQGTGMTVSRYPVLIATNNL